MSVFEWVIEIDSSGKFLSIPSTLGTGGEKQQQTTICSKERKQPQQQLTESAADLINADSIRCKRY